MTDLAAVPQPERVDAETIDAVPALPGRPVDPPVTGAIWADITSTERTPIVPAGLRTRAGRRALVWWLTDFAAYAVMFHAVRMPKYLALTACYTPRGVARAVSAPIRWAMAEAGNWDLRQRAAVAGDAATWMALDARRMRQSRWRWWVLLAAAMLAAVAIAAVAIAAPHWTRVVIATAAILVVARLGRPEDRPILDRVLAAGRYIRLTAELTRAALVATGVGIKTGKDVAFDREIFRDGPGYTAVVTLPTGVLAASVIDNRDYLAAGFRLPVAQVWPDGVPGAHPGVLSVWVADRPVNRMSQPKSPLLTDGKPLSFWGPLPFGSGVRMGEVAWRLDERNSLFGGMPGSGKTLAARNVALAAAMDPLVQFAVSELKGSGDFDAFEPLCASGLYTSGATEREKRQTIGILEWLIQECEQRPPLIKTLAARGLADQNKLTRAMAEADARVRPIVAIFDEIQELTTDRTLGKQATELLTSIIKRGRSLGIHLILATQRIDTKSIDKGISSNVSNRMCLAVQSHVEVDLVLGTGAYAQGARPTGFIPPADGSNPWAGWGWLAGRPQPIRASYLSNADARDLVSTAMSLRGQRGAAPDRVQMHDLAQDVRAVWPAGQGDIWVEALVLRLTELRPETYGSWSADDCGAALRRAGIATESLNRMDAASAKRATRVGVRRAALQAALDTGSGVAIGSGTATTP